MLGKLIKNEFVNRTKPILGLYAIVGVLAIVHALLNFVTADLGVNNQYMEITYALILITFVLSVYVSVVAIIAYSFNDYGTRLFKEQGYLTHTLPVKTIHVLFARMICDLCVCASMAIFYPLAICVSARDFSFIKVVYNEISSILVHGNVITVAFDLTKLIITLSLLALFASWLYYASYALGHSFSTGKRSKSVFFAIAFYIVIVNIIVFLEIALLDRVDFNYRHDLINIFLFIGVGIFVAITNTICKRRLNLE